MPRILTVPAPGATGVVDSSRGRIVYWAWRETTGTAGAAFRLWDSSNNSGALVAPFALAQGESVREFPGFHSLPYKVGLFLEILSGSVEGQVTVVPWADDNDYGAIPVVVLGGLTVEFNAEGVT